MSKKTFRRVVATASLVVGMIGACSAAAPIQTQIWDPHPINPQRCHNQEGPPPTPPTNGYCDVEVRLTRITFETGQKAPEGKGEIWASFTATPLDLPPGSGMTLAFAPEQDYTVGQTSGMNLDLGTYRVPVGDTREIEVCAGFVEDDDRGANGGDDHANGCTTLTLHCDAQTGQEALNPEIGPVDFHGEKVSLGSVSAGISVMAADADMDNIPNDDDFTPEICDEELKGTEGIAALVYFNYADPRLITLGQSLWTNLLQAYGAYDYVVLVADNEISNPGNFSGAAWANADRVFPPTREGLMDAMQHLTSLGYRFDTFVHAHGYKIDADDSDFETLKDSGGFISGEWLVDATDPDLIGTARGGIPIVAWWSTTCIAERQIDAWIDIGAVTANGAVDVQFYPNAWGNFVNNWIAGWTYQRAVDDSVTWLVVFEAEKLIKTEGSLPPWLCVGPFSVLGHNNCAVNFFNGDLAAYDISEVYDDTLSGAFNMAISSERTFVGNTQITFGAVNYTWP